MKNSLILFFFLLSFTLSAQVYKDKNAAVEDRVENLLLYMTLGEKLDYIGGIDGFYIRAIPRLGVPALKMSDGPVGARNDGATTAYPAGILTASTWNVDLVNQLGVALGKDARARGDHFLLGPGVNIYRAPMCGRNFEYFGEDPYLATQYATAYIKGVQSQGVVATVKHFAANNQEWNRYDVSSDVDERTLQEIYLPAFRAAVLDAKVGAVMNSYNLLNGVHATQNQHLNNDILKGQWSFDGILMSDWVSTHDGLAAAKGGLDLEMPNAAYMNSTTLLPYLNNGTLSQSVIDDKVRRILRIMFRFGFFDRVQLDSSIPLNNSDNDAVALKLAEEGVVLLKNQDSILPLHTFSIKNLAVIGPNANQYVAGGGSSYTTPFSTVTILQGIQQIAGSSVNITYNSGIYTYSDAAAKSLFYASSGSSTKGLTGNYYKNTQSFAGSPSFTRVDTIVDFHWMSGTPNISGWPASNYCVRWTGVIRPSQSGTYQFIARGDDGFRLSVNGIQVINMWQDQAATIATGTATLQAGKEYPVQLDFYQNGGAAEISLGYYLGNSINTEAVDLAKNADAAVVCVGFNSNLEGEGFDRPFELPAGQDTLINAIARVNPNTIVVVNAGGNVYMQNWVSKVKGLLYAWYPGQEGGKALAEILFGNVNPSGKLPVSFEKKWPDNPVYNNYYANNGTNRVKYNEGLFMGYRFYDLGSIQPMFAFSFGLSYTRFTYNNLIITSDTTGGDISYAVSFDITNSGSVAGSEVPQLYVGPIDNSVSRPKKELKGFSKVSLNPGESKTVTMKLDQNSLSYFDVASNSFAVEKGRYKILVGAASDDIRLTDTVSVITTRVIDAYSGNEYSIFPVPAHQSFTIFGSSSAKKIRVSLFDVAGHQVDSFFFESDRYVYDASRLKTGLYVCRIDAGSQHIIKKIVIQ